MPRRGIVCTRKMGHPVQFAVLKLHIKTDKGMRSEPVGQEHSTIANQFGLGYDAYLLYRIKCSRRLFADDQ
jgi:hypothetical protein